MTGKSTFRILSQRAGGGARSGIKDFKEWFQEMLGEMQKVADAGTSRYRGKISSISSVSDEERYLNVLGGKYKTFFPKDECLFYFP